MGRHVLGNSGWKRCGRNARFRAARSLERCGETLRQECPLPNGAFSGTVRGNAAQALLPGFRALPLRSVFAVGVNAYGVLSGNGTGKTLRQNTRLGRRVLVNSAGKRCGRVPAWSSAFSGTVRGNAAQALLPGFSCVVTTERFHCGRRCIRRVLGNSAGKALRRGARLGQRVLWNGAGKVLRRGARLGRRVARERRGGSAAAGSAARLFVRRQHGAFSLGPQCIRRVIREQCGEALRQNTRLGRRVLGNSAGKRCGRNARFRTARSWERRGESAAAGGLLFPAIRTAAGCRKKIRKPPAAPLPIYCISQEGHRGKALAKCGKILP